jgi:hypothetical protein
MKKFFAAFSALALTLAACAAPVRVAAPPTAAPQAVADFGYRRSVNALEYTDVAYHEWDAPDVAPQAKKLRTLLIYMNGSDLESETGAGTADLKELCRSGVDEDAVNVVIFTGGANRWHAKAISDTQCEISVLKNGKIAPVATVGERDMGDAGTLAAFIKFGLANYPAEHTSMILWDHGGGSIAGYGADEKFDMSALTLRELEFAFAKAGLADAPLEFLGFDACLMANVETALIAAPYAELLVASESLEPGDGWDYRAVQILGERDADGAAVSTALAEAYILSGGAEPTEELAISVVRTDGAEGVMGALGLLAERCREDLTRGGFAELTTARRGTKTFGDGTPQDAYCDMIDVADFAAALSERYPEEAADVRAALANAVAYNSYYSDRDLGGLSAYHIFGGAADAAQYTLAVYADLQMSEQYTRYLFDFADLLAQSSELLLAAPDREAELFGKRAELYEISRNYNGVLYGAACTVNGEKADALIFFDDGAAAGRILGYRRQDGYLIQKGYDKFAETDTVEFPTA